MKVIERVLDSVIRSEVDINSMQFGFMPGRHYRCNLHYMPVTRETPRHKHKPLYFAFVNLEKAFDRIPKKVL